MLPAFSVDTLETAVYVVQLFPRNVYLELAGCAEPGAWWAVIYGVAQSWT